MRKLIAWAMAVTLLAVGTSAISETQDYEEMVLGQYEQDGDLGNGAEPLSWLIVDETPDAWLCVSKYAIDNVPYNDVSEDTSWEDSSLRAWLNGEFIEQAFSGEAQALILPVSIANYANPDHGTAGGADTLDRVFLLDVQETNRYFPTAEDRMAFPSESAKAKGIIQVHDNCLWRLRTPGRTKAHAVIVSTTGEYDYCGLSVDYSLACIRPAMWVSKEVG